MWTFENLKQAREEADKDMAKIDPERLPVAVKIGIPPVLKADPRRLVWGGSELNTGEDETKKFCGCQDEAKLYQHLAKITKDIDERYVAREWMQGKSTKG